MFTAHTNFSNIIFTCPSIIYDIIIIESMAESGNFSGNFVVSMSNAHTTASLEDETSQTVLQWYTDQMFLMTYWQESIKDYGILSADFYNFLPHLKRFILLKFQFDLSHLLLTLFLVI